MRIMTIMWGSWLPMLTKAAALVSTEQGETVHLDAWSTRQLEDAPEHLETMLAALHGADAVLLYRTAGPGWETVEEALRGVAATKPVICASYDPGLWALSNVPAEAVARVYGYMTLGGEENFGNLLRYVLHLTGQGAEPSAPVSVPWDGIWHPDSDRVFEDTDTYLSWLGSRPGSLPADAPLVGFLFSRSSWVTGSLDVETALVRALEARGLRVLSVFCYSIRDAALGTRGSGAAVEAFMFGRGGASLVDAMVKLSPFLLGNRRGEGQTRSGRGEDILVRLNCPVFSPVVSHRKSVAEWREDVHGLGSDMSWSVAMPEFEGVIEPMIVAAARRYEDASGVALEDREPILERCRRLAARVRRWVDLRRTPVSERRIAFILHNNPCASVEATVGGAAKLDSLQSVADILAAMQATGYTVTVPENGQALIETIMERKAISEFRWTTVDEIVAKGGCLDQLELTTYERWWNTFPPAVRERIAGAWGDPPGREQNGIPAAMVHDGRILVTGVSYGNAVVLVQPKRGCAGARCDGQVCKILHDPDVPPPHQYIATYRWLEDVYGAHAIVHVGTHGNLEFLPGKGVGLSESCLPDLTLHELPHLYIYNADNPPEGVIAKRRGIAALVDHMQTVMVRGGLYDELEELERTLGDYEVARKADPARAHALEHALMELFAACKLNEQLGIKEGQTHHDLDFARVARSAHDALGRIRNTQIQDGMHIFGSIPTGDRRADFIWSILRFDAGREHSLRRAVCGLLTLDLGELLARPGDVHPVRCLSHGALLEEVETVCRQLVGRILDGQSPREAALEVIDLMDDPTHLDSLDPFTDIILDLDRRIAASLEIEALMHAFEGGFIAPGPSGLITRGRDDVLPTGRNFFTLDPRRVPTKAAANVGERLAQAVIDKHLAEEGDYPENVAMYWMSNDIMWADGEGMAQIMALIGVRPVWHPHGQLKGVEVIPLSELNRPRIDVTIRLSGITRDNFPNCVEVVDDALRLVAELDEPVELNYVRKHALTLLALAGADPTDTDAWRRATWRIFASAPGTYRPGVNLAVYASAWKTENDLAEIFVQWNSWAYGRGSWGLEAKEELVNALGTVDLTFNKVVTDESDLLACCCYFGTHGGIAAAAKAVSGNPVRNYYGDTREPEAVDVRDLSDEIRRIVRTKLLNPKWIEGMKRHGYKGAGDISKRVGRVYGWESTTGEVDDWIFDDIARTFALDDENRAFFEEHNPWALEEIGRRLLEAASRGLWQADPQVLMDLKETYLEIESWIEDRMDGVTGDFQGGSVDIITAGEVGVWDEALTDVRRVMERARSSR
jgi:cobaltochelatase CobN